METQRTSPPFLSGHIVHRDIVALGTRQVRWMVILRDYIRFPSHTILHLRIDNLNELCLHCIIIHETQRDMLLTVSLTRVQRPRPGIVQPREARSVAHVADNHLTSVPETLWPIALIGISESHRGLEGSTDGPMHCRSCHAIVHVIVVMSIDWSGAGAGVNVESRALKICCCFLQITVNKTPRILMVIISQYAAPSCALL